MNGFIWEAGGALGETLIGQRGEAPGRGEGGVAVRNAAERPREDGTASRALRRAGSRLNFPRETFRGRDERGSWTGAPGAGEGQGRGTAAERRAGLAGSPLLDGPPRHPQAGTEERGRRAPVERAASVS